MGCTYRLGFIIFIVIKGLRIAQKCKEPFGALMAIGISVMIGIQVFVNLGAVTGILPITGVTLPFVSYGGSSLTLLMLSMGVLTNISMFNKFEEKYKVELVKQRKLKSV